MRSTLEAYGGYEVKTEGGIPKSDPNLPNFWRFFFLFFNRCIYDCIQLILKGCEVVPWHAGQTSCGRLARKNLRTRRFPFFEKCIFWNRKKKKKKDSAIEKLGNETMFKGLRVRMGIHVGEPECQQDPVTGRMDYFGQMVNRSARVEGFTHGGQVVISSDVWQEIEPNKPG